MKYNIEKINLIAEKLAEIVEEAIEDAGQTGLQIGDVEMVLRESLREIGQKATRYFLENAGGEAEAEIECECGGKLKYQRQREATILRNPVKSHTLTGARRTVGGRENAGQDHCTSCVRHGPVSAQFSLRISE